MRFTARSSWYLHAALVCGIASTAAPRAEAAERLLVLDRWQATPGQMFSIAARDPYAPVTAGSTIYVQTLGSLWGITVPVLDFQSLAVHPQSGQLYSVARMQSVIGPIAAMVAIDRESGALTYVGAPSQITARFRFDPISLQFQWVDGKLSRTYSAPGGSNVFNPDLHFPSGDVNAGASPFSAGFAYEPPLPGDEQARAFLLDMTTDSLCVADFATGELTTIGALGVDLTGLVAGPIVELGGEIYFAADFGAGPRRYRVDSESGAATDVGEFPALHGITDMVLEPDLEASGDLDSDGYPDFVEVAAGSSVGDVASVPFVEYPVAPVKQAAPESLKSLRVELDFAAPGGDELVWKGKLPVVGEFAPDGQRVIAEVGDYAVAFTLGKKGKGIAAADGGVLQFGKKVKAGAITFKLKITNGAFAAYLTDEGLVDGDFTAAPLTVPLTLWVAGACYTVDAPVEYDAVAGVSGVAQ
jgi:Domain of unknown function (DUF4394)